MFSSLLCSVLFVVVAFQLDREKRRESNEDDGSRRARKKNIGMRVGARLSEIARGEEKRKPPLTQGERTAVEDGKYIERERENARE